MSSTSPRWGEVTGDIQLTLANGSVAPAADAVIWIPGVAAHATVKPSMASQAKRFSPHLLVVERGAAVTFPNLDHIYHNVFSTTPGQSFDLGLYRNGDGKARRFDTGGLVAVYCNIHPQMAAYIRVVDGAWATTGADGSFRIGQVPPGPHVVKVWHDRGGDYESQVVVVADSPSRIEVILNASKFRIVPHKNKHGEDYAPVALDDDRY
jgi:plastocyanin